MSEEVDFDIVEKQQIEIAKYRKALKEIVEISMKAGKWTVGCSCAERIGPMGHIAAEALRGGA